MIAPLVAWLRDAPHTIGLTTPQTHAWTAASGDARTAA